MQPVENKLMNQLERESCHTVSQEREDGLSGQIARNMGIMGEKLDCIQGLMQHTGRESKMCDPWEWQ